MNPTESAFWFSLAFSILALVGVGIMAWGERRKVKRERGNQVRARLEALTSPRFNVDQHTEERRLYVERLQQDFLDRRHVAGLESRRRIAEAVKH